MIPEEMQELVEDARLKFSRIKGWPVVRAVGACKICGGDIIYHKYANVEKTIKRKQPKVHSGSCSFIAEQRGLYKLLNGED